MAVGYFWGQRASAQRSHDAETVVQRLKRGASSAALTEQERAAFIPLWNDLERRVEAEAPDPSWSPQTEATIRQVVGAHLAPEVSIGALKCGSTLCRAELRHPGSPRIPYVKFVTFSVSRESLGSMEVQLDSRDEHVTTLYFLRGTAAAPQP